MFEPLPPRFDFPASEKRVLEFWEANRIFARSVEQRRGRPRYVFFEGPPTANGMPHPGHALTRAMKDIFPRYRTMCGFLVERKAGWDTHGLPVEREVEKELGLQGKADIEKFGVEKFILKCINSVWRYTREWEELTRRLAFWVNMPDAYATYHQSYVESVWWSLKTLFERRTADGEPLLYQAHKVVWWWPQGGTALSAGEVGEGYRTIDDPSVFVKFPLVGGSEVSGGTGGTGVPPVLNSTSALKVGRELSIRRRYLPHWQAGGSTYFITYRVFSGELSPAERTQALSAISHFDGQRYLLHAAVVMPDHVHAILTPLERSRGNWWSLPELLHGMKSFSGHGIAKQRGEGTGPVWMEEYFDRIIRSESEFDEKLNYVLTNPEKRGLPVGYEWVWFEDAHHKKERNGRDARTTHSMADPSRDARALADRTSLLVWTTTPWTLISNHFAAVHPDLEYSLVEDPGDATHEPEHLYIASALVEAIGKKIKRELRVISRCSGKDLIGLHYLPPFDAYYKHVPGEMSIHFGLGLLLEKLLRTAAEPLGQTKAELRGGGSDTIGWRVLAADFVTTESGTGLVHEAPAFGEVDFDLLRRERERFVSSGAVPLLCAVAPDGTFTHVAGDKYQGRFVKDCDKDIIRELKERSTPWGTPLLLHQEQVRHEYPFAPRAEHDALIQYARKSWFVRTSAFKQEFLKNNDTIYWLPEHIKEGRFGDFLRNNVDWALSRERFWGTPLPIWVCKSCGHMQAIGSFAELKSQPGATDATPEHPEGFWKAKVAEHKAAGEELPADLIVHKPYIDAWTYECTKCGNASTAGRMPAPPLPRASAHESTPRMRRVLEVIDCWWDAGSMPFAQWGFPHQPGSNELLTERFPADFISEAIDQTRGWFYSLLAINTMLFGPHERAADIGPAPGSIGLRPVRHPGVLKTEVTQQLNKRQRILPHWDLGDATYLVTFRILEGELSPEERTIVLNAVTHWHGNRVRIHGAVVMPDHVHILWTPLEKAAASWWSNADLLHSIKGFAAQAINNHRRTTGNIWQREYYDRIIRSKDDFDEKWTYLVQNPERKGLSADYQWVWVEPDRPVSPHSHSHRPEADAPHFAGAARYPVPFRACVVLGHIAGEDGNKMSKRLRNYKEPTYIFDQYGADAMRWYFFSAQAPWTSVRFQEAAIRDSQREFLVKLYNVLSFFTIYASIDGFVANPEDKAMMWRPAEQRGELDRWIVTELHRTVRGVREAMDRLENFPAAQRINDFVDGLSNWYVRRSRERFWSGDKNQAKYDAYHTLYGCLRVLSRLIAPFTPFFAETMHHTLKVPGDPDSVHLCGYPTPEEIRYCDEELSEEMDVVREIASLGRAARSGAKVKVRQPLSRVEIVLTESEHSEWLERHAALIAEELNVKQVEFIRDADQYVSYQVRPNFKALGPKFGQRAPQIASALKALADPAAARRALTNNGSLTLMLGDGSVDLTADEIEIRLEAKPGWSAAQGRAGVVVMSTQVTPELAEEGVVRELIHHVQTLRKDANLAYEARIALSIGATGDFCSIVGRYQELIRGECLASEIHCGSAPAGDPVEIEGRKVTAAIRAL